MKLWKIEYKVKPFSEVSTFPIDMLRYDQSMPRDTGDWSIIRNLLNYSINPTDQLDTLIKEQLKYGLRLIHYSHGNKNWQPTNERWKSFHWNVVSINPPFEY